MSNNGTGKIYRNFDGNICIPFSPNFGVYSEQILEMWSKRTGADNTMASKNNPSRRNRQQQEKMFDGKKVKPVLYVGSHVGHGRYMATQEEGGKLVTDKSGKPVPYSQV